jgi:hypothetical protein
LVRPTRNARTWGGRHGIEPSSPGWSPGALPKLCYSRSMKEKNCRTKVLHAQFSCQRRRSRRISRMSFDAAFPTLHNPTLIDRIRCHYLARASTRVTSSGCSLSPIQSSTAMVTIWLICGSGKCRLLRTSSINRSSPNSPKSFSGSVMPSL